MSAALYKDYDSRVWVQGSGLRVRGSGLRVEYTYRRSSIDKTL